MWSCAIRQYFDKILWKKLTLHMNYILWLIYRIHVWLIWCLWLCLHVMTLRIRLLIRDWIFLTGRILFCTETQLRLLDLESKKWPWTPKAMCDCMCVVSVLNYFLWYGLNMETCVFQNCKCSTQRYS